MPRASRTQVDHRGHDLHRMGLGACSQSEPGWPQGFGSGLECQLGKWLLSWAQCSPVELLSFTIVTG